MCSLVQIDLNWYVLCSIVRHPSVSRLALEGNWDSTYSDGDVYFSSFKGDASLIVLYCVCGAAGGPNRHFRLGLKSTPFLWDVIAEALLYQLNLYRAGKMVEAVFRKLTG